MKCPLWDKIEDARHLGDECPDPEACQGNWPCYHVRRLAAEAEPKEIPVNEQQRTMAEVLGDWWLEIARQDIERVVPKAVEYSAVDLIEYGRTLALVMEVDFGHPLTDEEATEIGIWGYLVGKVARWTGAIKEGRRVSDDTLHDGKIYFTMAERNRAVGGWPFGPESMDTPLPLDPEVEAWKNEVGQ